MVPQALFAGRKLNREISKPATANLHVMLKLSNDLNALQKEFNDKIPQINEILGLWGEVKGANPTTTGEAQLRSQSPIAEDRDLTSGEEDKGTTSNPVRNLDASGQADIIYIADASEDSGECAENLGIPSNLRTTDWLCFDGSYVHLEDTEPMSDLDERSMRRNSIPFNLRITEWLNDAQCDRSPNETSSSEPDSESEADSREPGPYDTFWTNHQ